MVIAVLVLMKIVMKSLLVVVLKKVIVIMTPTNCRLQLIMMGAVLQIFQNLEVCLMEMIVMEIVNKNKGKILVFVGYNGVSFEKKDKFIEMDQN